MGSPFETVPSYTIVPEAVFLRAVTWAEPRVAVTASSGAGGPAAVVVPDDVFAGTSLRCVRAAPARLPGRDDDHRHDGDRRKHDQDDVRLEPPRAALRRTSRRSADAGLLVVGAGDEAGVVLVDVELPVEPEVFGIGAEEALDVRLGREQRELLVLERAEILPADLGGELGLGEVDPPPNASLAEAVADLEQGAGKRRRTSAGVYCAQRRMP